MQPDIEIAHLDSLDDLFTLVRTNKINPKSATTNPFLDTLIANPSKTANISRYISGIDIWLSDLEMFERVNVRNFWGILYC